MNCAVAIAEQKNEWGSEPSRLNVLVVYEDLETGLRVSQVLDQLARELRGVVEVQPCYWRFDLSTQPTCLQKANIVFLSAHAQAQLPANFHSWFRDWLVQLGDAPRAVAVLVENSAQAPALSSKMAEEVIAAARLARVEVFVQPESLTAGLRSDTEELQHRSERILRLDEALRQDQHPPFRDWGINE